MTERLPKPDEPAFPVVVRGIEYTATPACASLFKHVGRAALMDYVRVQITDRTGTYLFSDAECFDIIAQYMIDNGYPVHLNVPRVASAARQAYVRAAIRDINNGIPDNWAAGEQ